MHLISETETTQMLAEIEDHLTQLPADRHNPLALAIFEVIRKHGYVGRNIELADSQVFDHMIAAYSATVAQRAPFFVYRLGSFEAPSDGPFDDITAAIACRDVRHHQPCGRAHVVYGTSDDQAFEKLFAHRFSPTVDHATDWITDNPIYDEPPALHRIDTSSLPLSPIKIVEHAPFYVYRNTHDAPAMGPYHTRRAALDAIRKQAHLEGIYSIYGTSDDPEFEAQFAHRRALTEDQIRDVALMRAWGEGYDDDPALDTIIAELRKMSSAKLRAEYDFQLQYHGDRLASKRLDTTPDPNVIYNSGDWRVVRKVKEWDNGDGYVIAHPPDEYLPGVPMTRAQAQDLALALINDLNMRRSTPAEFQDNQHMFDVSGQLWCYSEPADIWHMRSRPSPSAMIAPFSARSYQRLIAEFGPLRSYEKKQS